MIKVYNYRFIVKVRGFIGVEYFYILFFEVVVL